MNAPMLLATTWLLAAASSETVNFDNAEAGKPPSGWTATQTGTRPGEMDGGSRRHGSQQAERPEAIRPSDVSRVS